ncbi:hypothetical protein, partial [Streptomyces ossamyceticus]|uniref:hypothetical protein n=1 Tax=Streptomyces ossamyceticus TaxID=249581 RepID=UPI001969BD2D
MADLRGLAGISGSARYKSAAVKRPKGFARRRTDMDGAWVPGAEMSSDYRQGLGTRQPGRLARGGQGGGTWQPGRLHAGAREAGPGSR